MLGGAPDLGFFKTETHENRPETWQSRQLTGHLLPDLRLKEDLAWCQTSFQAKFPGHYERKNLLRKFAKTIVATPSGRSGLGRIFGPTNFACNPKDLRCLAFNFGCHSEEISCMESPTQPCGHCPGGSGGLPHGITETTFNVRGMVLRILAESLSFTLEPSGTYDPTVERVSDIWHSSKGLWVARVPCGFTAANDSADRIGAVQRSFRHASHYAQLYRAS